MFQFLGAIDLASNPLIFMVGIIAIMFGLTYFTSIKPQKKREQLHKNMLSELAKGDKIMTIGGFYAKINAIKDDTVIIELLPSNTMAEITKEAIRSKVEE